MSDLTPVHHVPFFLLGSLATAHSPHPTASIKKIRAPTNNHRNLHPLAFPHTPSPFPLQDFFLSFPTDIPKESSALLSSSDSSSPPLLASHSNYSSPYSLALLLCYLCPLLRPRVSSPYTTSGAPAARCACLVPRGTPAVGSRDFRTAVPCAWRSRRTRKGLVLETQASRSPLSFPWFRFVSDCSVQN